MHRELPSELREKPITSASPLARAYEADVIIALNFAKQGARMEEKVSRRATERLEIAEARHKRVLAGLETQHDAEVQRVLLDSDRRQNEAQKLDIAASTAVDQIEAKTRDHEDAYVRHVAARQTALDRVDLARSQAVTNTAAVEAQLKKAQQQADEVVASSRQSANSHLVDLSRLRAEIQAKMAQDAKSREKQCELVQEELDVNSRNEMVRAEITRHRAIMAMDIAGGRTQELQTELQARVFKHESKANDQVSKLDQDRHLMDCQVDSALKEKLRDSALSLEAAHEYCQEVKKAVDSESTQFKRRIREIELGTGVNCREEDRKVRNLEKERLQEFMQAQGSVRQSESGIRSKRAESDAEVEDYHRRLREVETYTRQRAEEIYQQLLSKSEAAEEAVRSLEQQGQRIMEEFNKKIADRLKVFLEEDAAAKVQGSANVADLERRATTVIETTQSDLELARHADERAAAAATARWREAKKQPEEISKKADDEIAAKERSAQEEEAELRSRAEVRIAAAKAATKAAYQEELWLQAQSAEAWTRLRKASFELKKVNLHDLAQSTLAGDYDAQMDYIKDFVKVC